MGLPDDSFIGRRALSVCFSAVKARHPRIPTCPYWLQFNRRFRFAGARETAVVSMRVDHALKS